MADDDAAVLELAIKIAALEEADAQREAQSQLCIRRLEAQISLLQEEVACKNRAVLMRTAPTDESKAILASLVRREDQIGLREGELDDRERILATREVALASRERDLDARVDEIEATLSAREARIAERENQIKRESFSPNRSSR